MEVIELTSYTDEEKLQIAKRHLLPKQMKEHGLKKTPAAAVGRRASAQIISGYTTRIRRPTAGAAAGQGCAARPPCVWWTVRRSG